MKLATLKVNNSNLIEFLKSLCPPVLWAWIYKRLVIRNIPSASSYKPHYCPWRDEAFKKKYSAVRNKTGLTPEALYNLEFFLGLTARVPGDVFELGVWKGGSARVVADFLSASNKTLYLFDSFEGMQHVDTLRDRHVVGDFGDTSLEGVKEFVLESVNKKVEFKKGWIPQTFSGLDKISISFAHIDLDLKDSIDSALDFICPRLSEGAVVVFDDYGFASCPGAKVAVDQFILKVGGNIFVLPTGQAVFFNN